MVKGRKTESDFKLGTMNNVGMLNAFTQEPQFDVWRQEKKRRAKGEEVQRKKRQTVREGIRNDAQNKWKMP